MTTKQKRAANRRGQRQVPRASSERQASEARPPNDGWVYWATPKVWSRRCGLCGRKGSEVYRHGDQSSLCGLCAERLSVEVYESKATKAQTRRKSR